MRVLPSCGSARRSVSWFVVDVGYFNILSCFVHLGSIVQSSGSTNLLPTTACCKVLTAATMTTMTSRGLFIRIVPAVSCQVASFPVYKTRWSVLSAVLVEVLGGVLVFCVLPIPLVVVLQVVKVHWYDIGVELL